MPNRTTTVRRNSVVEMIAKVPVNRGSLLKSIESLLKTIESSESAVMIPTLLRDKVRVDAWELLFVAKILKASILGHSDLVEFYMNHVSHAAAAAGQQPATGGGESLSPSLGRRPSPMASPQLGQSQQMEANQLAQQQVASNGLSTASSASSISSASAPTTTTTTSGGAGANYTTTSNNLSARSSSSTSNSASWLTASQQQTATTILTTESSAPSSLSSGSSLGEPQLAGQLSQQQLSNNFQLDPQVASGLSEQHEAALLAAKPLLMRQAQPPSLLQLTTTNNHIQSVAANFSGNSLEQLTNQLAALQPPASERSPSGGAGPGLSHLEAGQLGGLSISTAGQTSGGGPLASPSAERRQAPGEFRTSRSAGCLFRANSGASSPRTPTVQTPALSTPTTPYPQAETLSVGQTNGLVGDPSAPVKLLLQIEQLKVSISHVTTLLESVVELYKKSIDNIAV